MGEVFLAKQRGPSGFEKLLVIKRILSHHLDKKDYLDMFFSEAKLVARLNHNNIIQIHEMGEIDGDYYIAMEYVRGKSLRDIIDELRAEGRMLPLPYVVDLAIKLSEGLGYAHQARDIRGRPMNIVHRDINPHNVLISYNGDLKLIDFGIAKSEMTSVHTATGTIKGKFVYMSPEQSAADPIDRRSDIFSLGIVLYEMTVLENPFVRQNVVLSLEAIQRHPIPPPSAKRADAAPIDAILMKALEKRPEDRYQSALEMRDDLRNLFRIGVVRPAEEDVSVFLHELFSADIEEEDRLLAEADRATTPPNGMRGGDALARDGELFEGTDDSGPLAPATSDAVPAAPGSGISGLSNLAAMNSSSSSGATFPDEEPTLSGSLEGMAQRSREVSRGLPIVEPMSRPVAPLPGPEASPLELPAIGEDMLPETPTRSDRIPGRISGGLRVPGGTPPAGMEGARAARALGEEPGLVAGTSPSRPSRPMPADDVGLSVAAASRPGRSALGDEAILPSGEVAPPARAPSRSLSGAARPARAQLPDEHGAAPRAASLARAGAGLSAVAKPWNPGAVDALERPREVSGVRVRERSSPSAAPGGAVFHRVEVPEDDRPGAPETVVPPLRGRGHLRRWRPLVLVLAGLLVFVATAVAGFFATRAVTRPAVMRGPMPQVRRASEDDRPPPKLAAVPVPLVGTASAVKPIADLRAPLEAVAGDTRIEPDVASPSGRVPEPAPDPTPAGASPAAVRLAEPHRLEPRPAPAPRRRPASQRPPARDPAKPRGAEGVEVPGAPVPGAAESARLNGSSGDDELLDDDERSTRGASPGAASEHATGAPDEAPRRAPSASDDERPPPEPSSSAQDG